MRKLPLSIVVLGCFVSTVHSKGGPGTSVKAAAASETPSTTKTFAECICKAIDECMEGEEYKEQKKKAKEMKNGAVNCLSVPTKEQAVAHSKAQFKSRKPSLSDAAAQTLAENDCAQGGARNNAVHSGEDTHVFFIPSETPPGLWLKKVAVFDEINDIITVRDDPGGKAGGAAGIAGRPGKAAEALRRFYVDLKGYMDDLKYLDDKKPAGAPPAGHTAAAATTKENLKTTEESFSTIWAAYEGQLPAGGFKTALGNCRTKARELLGLPR